VLYRDDHLGELIEFQNTFVVGGPKGFEKCRGYGKKGHMFNVRVASSGIRGGQKDIGVKDSLGWMVGNNFESNLTIADAYYIR
jgi:hypothetical protein